MSKYNSKTYLTRLPSAISVLAMLLSLLSPRATAQDSGEVIDRIIAIVGDEIILESEVYQNAQSLALQQGMNLLKDQSKFEKLKEDVLQEMINQKVLLAKAREDSIVVEAREVDRELENRLQQIIQNVGSEEKLEEVYGYPIRRIRREFRTTVQEGLLVDKVKYQHLNDIRVTRAEIEQYYQEHPEAFPKMKDAVEIAHILRETGSGGKAEVRAQARADSIYEAIRSGASFDSLAKWLSEDPNTAKNYGRIGWTEKGDLLSTFEDAAYALKPGEISRPVQTRYGFHIIRMDDRREDKILTSHILVKVKTSAEDEIAAVDSLEKVRSQILVGRSFEEAAKNVSQDLESANSGGYLGWFALEEMPPDFRAALDTLQVGQICRPFKTQYGYHIIQLLNRRDARPITLDQDWELISQRALNAKREKEYHDWLEDLKSRYFIEIKT